MSPPSGRGVDQTSTRYAKATAAFKPSGAALWSIPIEMCVSTGTPASASADAGKVHGTEWRDVVLGVVEKQYGRPASDLRFSVTPGRPASLTCQ
jgi:hypothetical protein